MIPFILGSADSESLFGDKDYISLKSLELSGEDDAMEVEANRDRDMVSAMSLPPIAVLEDLPDFEELGKIEDIVERTNGDAMPHVPPASMETDQYIDSFISDPQIPSRLTAETDEITYVDVRIFQVFLPQQRTNSFHKA